MTTKTRYYRTTKGQQDHNERMRLWKEGHTDRQIANITGVQERTISAWREREGLLAASLMRKMETHARQMETKPAINWNPSIEYLQRKQEEFLDAIYKGKAAAKQRAKERRAFSNA